jgi:hypothetical protein
MMLTLSISKAFRPPVLMVLSVLVFFLTVGSLRAQDSLNISLIGSLEMSTWGEITGLVAVGDSVIFSSEEYGWAVLDVSDPSALVEVARPMPEEASYFVGQRDDIAIAKTWTRAYMIDVSNPIEPAVIDSFSRGDAFSCVAFDYPYYFGTADYFGPDGYEAVAIYNLSDPSNITRVEINGMYRGSLSSGANHQDVLYLGKHNDSLYWVDLALAEPEPHGFSDLVPQSLVDYQNYLYALSWDRDDVESLLTVFDITDPRAPVEMASIVIAETGGQLQLVGDTLAIKSDPLIFLSLADPVNPTVLTQFDVGTKTIWNVQSDVVHAFYADRTEHPDTYTSWLREPDGDFQRSADYSRFSTYNDLFIEDDWLYVLSDFQTFEKIDLSADEPMVVDTVVLDHEASQMYRNLDRLATFRHDPGDSEGRIDWYAWNDGNPVFLNTESLAQQYVEVSLTVLDASLLSISDKTSPWSQHFEIRSAYSPTNLFFSNPGLNAYDPNSNLLWATSRFRDSLFLIETEDFTSLDTLATWDYNTPETSYGYHDLCTNGPVAGLAYSYGGSNPGGYDHFSGNGLSLLEASDPFRPGGGLSAEYNEMNIWIVGNYLFQDKEDRFDVFDITNSAEPDLRGYYPFDDEIVDIHVDDQERIIVESERQILILDGDAAFENPIFPVYGVEGGDYSGTPLDYRVGAAWPNPFNARASLTFNLPVNSRVTITVYNVLGQRVSELVDAEYAVGSHTVQFDASDLASGLYFIRTFVPGHLNRVQKVVLVR